jgi:acid phosphatase family membrane protein YuiD
MGIVHALLSNNVLVATLMAWVLAQSIKVALAMKRQRRFDVRWFLGTGGMPSAHSAGVAALAMGVGLNVGFATPLFAVALIFALVTMFDAQGVRRATGKQAVVLNHILDELYARGQVNQQRVKELLGHTPVEVFVGGLLGCLVAIAVCRG